MISILAFLFVFTIVVLIHEFGHFITARRLGINAYEFSVGFPFSPKIVTLFRHKETEFTLRLLPLGGFVRFSKDEEADESLEFLKEKRWKRGIIISAGSIFNIIFAFLLIAIALMFAKHISLFDAAIASLKTIEAVSVGTIQLIFNLFAGNGSMDSLSGPIGIAVMAGKAADAGFINLLYFTGLLSLSLGILNLLPFPALDGGHLIILAIESLKKSPLSHRTYQIIGVAGISFFIILTIFVTYKDILRLIA
ncbi:MAG: peptidase M50 [Nitrospinae bacterium RIFCSPLOWO2_12_39_16]|nr:MAG: peptidase M50 [Nitrospinae bacterium RIFCSPLOWO2_02_39_17]OGW13266.1 MAG: peptidase M50 [Nitrospinae bacterium RIFCSPLOWO2_12_39_16]